MEDTISPAAQACANMALYAAGELDEDPYLAYRPSFAYSMPAQVFLQGITFTLLTVLLIHILFTTPYHWPLSRLNYLLQVSGVLLVIGSVLFNVGLTMTAPDVVAQEWPYMLEYISVAIPPVSWSIPAQAGYQLLQCLCNLAVSLAHIQFLTLLFPSATEVKLIFLILGPLALVSSGLSFTALSSNRTTIDLGDAIANVFDSTLILIFTISLLLWGLLVNRQRAWRFDGGTAIFGGGAIGLALLSTASNFILVKEDGLNWLQNLVWAVILWQSWLGFWWWTGSGMGIGEVEDLLAKEERHKIKAERRKRRMAARNKAAGNASDNGSAGRASVFARSVMDGFRTNGILSHRIRRNGNAEEEIELDDISPAGSADREAGERPAAHVSISEDDPRAAVRRAPLTPSSSISTSSRTPTLNPPNSISNAFMYPFILMQIYVRRLRQGHEAATKAKALERVERRNKAFHVSAAPAAGSSSRTRAPIPRGPTGTGWGLGSFAIQEAEEARERIGQTRRIMRSNRLLTPDEEDEIMPAPETGSGSRTPVRGQRSRALRPNVSDEEAGDLSDAELGHGAGAALARQRSIDSNQAIADLEREMNTADEAGWVDEATIQVDPPARPSSVGATRRTPQRPRGGRRPASPRQGQAGPSRISASANASRRIDDSAPDSRDGAGEGWSWWGPFRKWRLADRSTF